MDYHQIRVGMTVDFHIDRMGHKIRCTVTREPWFMAMIWVCMVDKVDRCVPCDKLSPVRY
jgi:hypothetical protein